MEDCWFCKRNDDDWKNNCIKVTVAQKLLWHKIYIPTSTFITICDNIILRWKAVIQASSYLLEGTVLLFSSAKLSVGNVLLERICGTNVIFLQFTLINVTRGIPTCYWYWHLNVYILVCLPCKLIFFGKCCSNFLVCKILSIDSVVCKNFIVLSLAWLNSTMEYKLPYRRFVRDSSAHWVHLFVVVVFGRFSKPKVYFQHTA